MNFKIGDLFAQTKWMKFTTLVIFEDMNSNISVYKTITENVCFEMLFLFLLQGCMSLCHLMRLNCLSLHHQSLQVLKMLGAP